MCLRADERGRRRRSGILREMGRSSQWHGGSQLPSQHVGEAENWVCTYARPALAYTVSLRLGQAIRAFSKEEEP